MTLPIMWPLSLDVGFGACGDFGGRDLLLEKPEKFAREAPKPEGEEEQEDLEDPDASIYRVLRMFDRKIDLQCF